MDLDDAIRACMLGVLFVIISLLGMVARDKFMAPWIGDYISHFIIAVILIGAVIVIAYILISGLKDKYRREGFKKIRRDLPFISLVWFAMSFLAGLTLKFTMQNYFAIDQASSYWKNWNILRGRLTGLLMLVIAMAPYVLGNVMLRRRHHRSRRYK